MSEKHERVLLVNPPGSGRGKYSSPPLGILYCAGVLKQNDIPVSVVDGCIEGWGSALNKIREFKPTIVGVTCPTYARSKTLEISLMIKKEIPKVKIILGGPHPTIMGKQILENYPFVDMVAVGESDHLISDICKGVDIKNIPGLGFRKDQEIVFNAKRPNIESLDDIPFPAWDLIEPRKYFTDDRGIYENVNLDVEPCGFLTFSRGCVGSCNFCSNRLIWNRWRHRSPENATNEIELLNREYGIRHFHFNDDCFSANPQVAMELCESILKRKLKILFDIVTRADCVNEKLIKSLKAAGCYKINFGVETASPRLLKIMGKPINLERSIQAINLTCAAKMQSGVFIIAGCLGETWETINETVDFLKNLTYANVSVSPGMMVFPGTSLYEYAKKQNFINDSFWLTDYNWKIYTAENSRFKLNIYAQALRKNEKLSRYFKFDFLRYNRFVTKEIEYRIKDSLAKFGIRKKKKKYKYKVAY